MMFQLGNLIQKVCLQQLWMNRRHWQSHSARLHCDSQRDDCDAVWNMNGVLMTPSRIKDCDSTQCSQSARKWTKSPDVTVQSCFSRMHFKSLKKKKKKPKKHGLFFIIDNSFFFFGFNAINVIHTLLKLSFYSFLNRKQHKVLDIIEIVTTHT